MTRRSPIVKAKDPILRLTDHGLLFQKRPLARGKVVVFVDIEKASASLAKDPAFYVGPGGTGEIEGRIAGAHSFFEKAKAERIPVHMTEMHVRPGGELGISDGRHRFAALRERGAEIVPVMVDPADAEEIATKYGADPTDRIRDVTGEERKRVRDAARAENQRLRERILADREAREAALAQQRKSGGPAIIPGVAIAPPPKLPEPKPRPLPISVAPPAQPPRQPPGTRRRSAGGGGGRRRPPMPKLAEQVFRAHLDQLHRHIEQNGVKGLSKMYAEARAEIVNRLRSIGKLSQSVEAQSLRAMLAQVDAVAQKLGKDFKKHLGDVGSAAVEMGARHGVDEFRVLETAFTGTTPIVNVASPAVFSGLVKNVDSSLLRRHSIQAGTWSGAAVLNMERRLGVSAMTGKPLEAVVDDLVTELDTERYKAERIVRTEMSYAHGASKQQVMQETAAEFEIPLLKRLIETFDDRTGDDSFLLHGQTVPVDKPFVWKKKSKGGWELVEFMHPPNRPNDRAVVIPWNPTWEDVEGEKALTLGELASAGPTRWRSKAGVEIPPGHEPGKAYGRSDALGAPPPKEEGGSREEPEPDEPEAAEEPEAAPEPVRAPPPPPPEPPPPPAEPAPSPLAARLRNPSRLLGERKFDYGFHAKESAEELFGRGVEPEEFARLAGMPPGGGNLLVTGLNNGVSMSIRYVRPPTTITHDGVEFEIEWGEDTRVAALGKFSPSAEKHLTAGTYLHHDDKTGKMAFKKEVIPFTKGDLTVQGNNMGATTHMVWDSSRNRLIARFDLGPDGKPVILDRSADAQAAEEASKLIDEYAAKMDRAAAIRDFERLRARPGAPVEKPAGDFVSEELLAKIQAEFEKDKILSYTSIREVKRRFGTTTDGIKSPDYVYLKNELLLIYPSGTGAGTEIFARQVLEAEKLGVEKIKTDAAKGKDFNGYYTWARLGYEADVPDHVAKHFPGAKKISDVISTEEGLKKWKDLGGSFSGEFDTRPGSYSRGVLERYLRDREAKKK